jgi:hypothetical protein
MTRMQVNALFTTVGRILAIVAVTLLSACHVPLVNVETRVDVKCPSGQMGPGGEPGDPGPGVNCGLNKILVTAGTPVPTNAIPINPTGGTIPTGATCSSQAGSAQSYKCNASTLGFGCGITPQITKCHNTYNMTNTRCDCGCY